MAEKEGKKREKNLIPFRINLLFLTVFFAFSTLIVRLGVVQIVNGKVYTRRLDNMQNVTNKIQSPRGLIFDRNGVKLAGNKASNSVMFTRNPSMSERDLIQLANKLIRYIPVSTVKTNQAGELLTTQVTQRDLKDFWIASHPNAYKEKLTASEQKESNQKAYKLLLSRITKKDLQSISKSELKVVVIWRELEQASNLSPTQIASHLTTKEVATLGEHLGQFKGAIRLSVAANRIYPKGNLFFLGKVGSIPHNELSNYLADGLTRNDLVGTSYLEQEYNRVLSGIPKTLTFSTKNGIPVGSPKVKEGRRGDDLVLTIDYKLQKKVNQIIQKQIKACYPKDHLCNQAYAVVMNPHTGGILAISGQKYNGHKFQDVSEGALLNSFAIGSAVKGATVLAGYQNHAIPGTMTDKPIHFPGTKKTFSSEESNIGSINTAEALEHSSNVYMGTIAAKMAGFQITDKGPYYLARVSTGNKFIKAFKTLRDAYGQFGLGVHTGVDLPYEATGYKGPTPKEGGLIMQFAIGQYDTYTPLQMAQYVSTIANGGYRLAPHFLKSIHYPGRQPNRIGPTEYQYTTKILNKIPNTPAQFQTVHKGFYLVTHGAGGTAKMLGWYWPQYHIAAKTGTAQVGKIGSGRNNKTLVAFAPYKHPQVAISVVVPDILGEPTNLYIGGNIIQAYFQNKKKK